MHPTTYKPSTIRERRLWVTMMPNAKRSCNDWCQIRRLRAVFDIPIHTRKVFHPEAVLDRVCNVQEFLVRNTLVVLQVVAKAHQYKRGRREDKCQQEQRRRHEEERLFHIRSL